MKKITKQDVEVFRKILGSGQRSKLLMGEEASPYFCDWTGAFKTVPGMVAFPDSTEQVSHLLSFCSAQAIGVVPQGGLTGLVGGGVPRSPNELVINLSKMDQILEVNKEHAIASLEAGVILETADKELSAHNLMMPVDLGAKGSCQIGGLLACNAGGTRFRRYGSLHANCNGLEVVLPDGMVLDLRRSRLLRKNNTGLDLKHLFIGSEGTLGIITKTDILCPQVPKESMVALISLNSWEQVVKTFQAAVDQIGYSMAAFEFWDGESEELVSKHAARTLKRPTGQFNVLVEVHGQVNMDRALESFLETISSRSMIVDAVIAYDKTQSDSIWAVRESITESCAKEGLVFKYDISLPLPTMYAIRRFVQESFGATVKVVGFGHVGDGNIHLNVIAPRDIANSSELKMAVDRVVYDYVYKANGSISAEHGIGQLKLSEYMRSVEPSKLFVSQLIKQQLDPFGIMNPGKLFKYTGATNVQLDNK